MSPSTIRFLVLSDTHHTGFPDPATLPKADVILHCGDLTMRGGLSEYKPTVERLSACNAELKLVIPGNHDLTLDQHWWTRHCQEEDADPDDHNKARAMFDFKTTGIRLLDEGNYTFTLRDGRSFTMDASPYTPYFCDWAFAYGSQEDRFGPDAVNPIPKGVDVVVTHGPPRVPDDDYFLDQIQEGKFIGCSTLWNSIRRTRPRLHCFGHVHEGYGAKAVRWRGKEKAANWATEAEPPFDLSNATKGESGALIAGSEGETLLVNAAIMDNQYDARNQALIVDLESSRASL
ncbi:Metallophosphoesterase domain-containing protein 1 [Colletotrichum sp. SAR11_59]|nr:Metallophosphoesterase domain-containing protein 1 [Colletotrichum sp. SAR11_59]